MMASNWKKNDDVTTYNWSKLKLSKMWHILYPSKDDSVLIIFYLNTLVSTTLPLELGDQEWKMICHNLHSIKNEVIQNMTWLYQLKDKWVLIIFYQETWVSTTCSCSWVRGPGVKNYDVKNITKIKELQ